MEKDEGEEQEEEVREEIGILFFLFFPPNYYNSGNVRLARGGEGRKLL